MSAQKDAIYFDRKDFKGVIRCSKDRPFDIDNPSEDSFCEGCTVERNVIMDLLKSYRRAFGVCE